MSLETLWACYSCKSSWISGAQSAFSDWEWPMIACATAAAMFLAGLKPREWDHLTNFNLCQSIACARPLFSVSLSSAAAGTAAATEKYSYCCKVCSFYSFRCPSLGSNCTKLKWSTLVHRAVSGFMALFWVIALEDGLVSWVFQRHFDLVYHWCWGFLTDSRQKV